MRYFEDLDEIERFLNRNLRIDYEGDKEVNYWCIKKRYFNEIVYEDEYSGSEEGTTSSYSEEETSYE